ncbi:hypothetical protein SAMN05444392_101646 [Seinonella peptonophila]|uniref:Uncharacterized protein n=1 Tax=Seinonella peptonophila TaxID=112248 RepID=A0A1M4TU74_9BACL|nr:hypothetical protein SAMN05444392_101646 [Seinonella peptonophila]
MRPLIFGRLWKENIALNLVKSMVKKTYRGMIFIIFLSVLLIGTVLLITFLADPMAMFEHIKQVFGLKH